MIKFNAITQAIKHFRYFWKINILFLFLKVVNFLIKSLLIKVIITQSLKNIKYIWKINSSFIGFNILAHFQIKTCYNESNNTNIKKRLNKTINIFCINLKFQS